MPVFRVKEKLITGSICEVFRTARLHLNYEKSNHYLLVVVDESNPAKCDARFENRIAEPVVYLHHQSGSGDAIVYEDGFDTLTGRRKYTLAKFDIIKR